MDGTKVTKELDILCTDEISIPGNVQDCQKVDNTNPKLGKNSRWVRNHVPRSDANIATKAGIARLNIHPDSLGALDIPAYFCY